MSKRRAFFNYCDVHNRAPLPASVDTLIGCILFELQRGALAPPSLSNYLSAVASLHHLAGHDDPTKDKLVQLAVYGFRAHALERAGGELALLRMPLPAAYILKVCDLGMSTPDDYLQLQCAGLVLGYVLFNKPGTAACVRRCDVAFSTHGMGVQVVVFKLALRTGRERLAVTVPVDVDKDRTRSPPSSASSSPSMTAPVDTRAPSCSLARRCLRRLGSSGLRPARRTPGSSASCGRCRCTSC